MDKYLIKNLYDSGNLQEIITLWENEEERKQFSDWDYVHVMNTFYGQKDYRQCLEVYRAFHAAFPDSDRLDDKMGWACYYLYIKDFDFKNGDKKKLKQQIDYVFEHSGRSKYSPKWRLALYLHDHRKNGDFGQDMDDREMLKYLDMVDPEELSTTSNSFTAPNGRTVEKASDMENWYKMRSKLLLTVGEYEVCLECCDKALNRLPAFHQNNDSWFRYRKAKSLYALGKPDEARKYIKEIQAKGLNHWCMLQLLYETDVSEGKDESAMMHAGMCALSDQSHEMRVSFYPDYADYLESKGFSEEAALHRHLVILLRNENEWALRERHLAWVIPEEIGALAKQETLQKLKAFWTECRDKNQKWYTGTVSAIIADGGAGFINSDDNNRYYFNSRDFKGKPEIGMKVRYTLIDRLDKKKGIVKPNAVQISVI